MNVRKWVLIASSAIVALFLGLTPPLLTVDGGAAYAQGSCGGGGSAGGGGGSGSGPGGGGGGSGGSSGGGSGSGSGGGGRS